MNPMSSVHGNSMSLRCNPRLYWEDLGKSAVCFDIIPVLSILSDIKVCKFCFIFEYSECFYDFVFRAEFEFTSQYVIQVDDFFLHYLQKVSFC